MMTPKRFRIIGIVRTAQLSQNVVHLHIIRSTNFIVKVMVVVVLAFSVEIIADTTENGKIVINTVTNLLSGIPLVILSAIVF